ncbi:hypothetical protein EC844_10654 [Acinetobacter calcoaceticus]|uniref:Uncharacterized protein n=1 Tax=Acinetobacter calcoaceticus TaxID=471 RepID=A0A4R1XXR0_ACICA|nr:hypothetical protein EC844_10654 [Acinetobacter calcoaceticus]
MPLYDRIRAWIDRIHFLDLNNKVKNMKTFDLDITYPHHQSPEDAEIHTGLDATEVLAIFDRQNWRHLMKQAIEINDLQPLFMLYNQQNNTDFWFNPNSDPEIRHIYFQIGSSTEVIVPTRVFFGLFNKNIKQDIEFSDLTQQQMRQYLVHYLNAEMDLIKQKYLQSLNH